MLPWERLIDLRLYYRHAGLMGFYFLSIRCGLLFYDC